MANDHYRTDFYLNESRGWIETENPPDDWVATSTADVHQTSEFSPEIFTWTGPIKRDGVSDELFRALLKKYGDRPIIVPPKVPTSPKRTRRAVRKRIDSQG